MQVMGIARCPLCRIPRPVATSNVQGQNYSWIFEPHVGRQQWCRLLQLLGSAIRHHRRPTAACEDGERPSTSAGTAAGNTGISYGVRQQPLDTADQVRTQPDKHFYGRDSRSTDEIQVLWGTSQTMRKFASCLFCCITMVSC